MSSLKKILIVCERNSHRAPRLYNEYLVLKNDFDILIAGDFKPNYIDESRFIDININPIILKNKKKSNSGINFIHNQFLKLKFLFSFGFVKPRDIPFLYDLKYYYLNSKLKALTFDILIYHHISSLPFMVYFSKKSKSKLIVNLHEYYPKEFNDQNNWSRKEYYLNSLCARFLKEATLLFCVNKSISEEYAHNFDIDKSNILVFYNVKNYEDTKPSIVDENNIKLVHHGAAIPSRNLDKMIDLVNLLPKNYSLTLILVPSNREYFKRLKRMKTDKVIFEKPASSEKISKMLNQYDIGLYLLSPSNFNESNALPNKYFEFIQANLCLAVSPIDEMKEITEKNNFGVVSNSFDVNEMANCINALSVNDIESYKINVHEKSKLFSLENFNSSILDRVLKL